MVVSHCKPDTNIQHRPSPDAAPNNKFSVFSVPTAPRPKKSSLATFYARTSVDSGIWADSEFGGGMAPCIARRRPARGTPPRLGGRPARGSRLVITAAYVEERLARAREGRRRPGVRDARCCHASGAPVMPAWRHSATHAAHGRGERRGGCAPSRAERATRLSST